MRGLEHVLFFLKLREKVLCVDDGMTFQKNKKKDLKIGFLKYGNTGTPAGPYSYYYIYIYISSHSSHTISTHRG